jgi:hypothetical protein
VQQFPLQTGAYNQQKVALTGQESTVYEIDCMINPGDTSAGSLLGTTAGVNSLEYCMYLCTNSVNCQVAYWGLNSNPKTCSLYQTLRTANKPYPQVFNVRTARKLTPTNSQVVDATYFLAPSMYNLGICEGPDNNYFHETFIVTYSPLGTLRDPSGRGDTWLITCGTKDNGIAGTQLDSATTQSTFGLIPTTADDCARLCSFANWKASDGTGRCRSWRWFGNGRCDMYADRPGYPGTLAPPAVGPIANLVASGIYRGQTSGGTSENYEVAAYRKRSLPPGLAPMRRRDLDSRIARSLGEMDLVPDVILPLRLH